MFRFKNMNLTPLTEKGEEFLSTNSYVDERTTMTRENIFPRVIHRDYFKTMGIEDPLSAGPNFGFVRSIGQDVFAFLSCRGDKTVSNLRDEHAKKLGLDEESAWEIARQNTLRIAFDGASIQQMLTKTVDGNDWAAWLGNFASSTVLLP